MSVKQLKFTRYRRKQIAELAPWEQEANMSRVSISPADKEAGSPKAGDMIARNPKNHDDQWLIAAQYFADNFELVRAAPYQGATVMAFDHLDDSQLREATALALKAAHDCPMGAMRTDANGHRWIEHGDEKTLGSGAYSRLADAWCALSDEMKRRGLSK